jgi:hypothetical protein
MVSTIGTIPMQDIKTGQLDQGGMKAMSTASAKIAADMTGGQDRLLRLGLAHVGELP